MTVTIIYADTPDGAISDFQLEREFKALLKKVATGDDETVTCSSSIFFDRVRVGVRRGEISRQDVVFEFEGETIKMDDDGRLAHLPPGFLNTWDRLLMELI